jgi:hypothetical protein
MKRSSLKATMFLAAALSVPEHLAAQLPAGTDINSAIPIYFGQTITDLADVKTIPIKVYSMTLAKGQQVSAALTSPQGEVRLVLFPSTMLSVEGCGYNTACNTGFVANGGPSGGGAGSSTLTTTIASSGTYYFVALFGLVGTNYTLQVNSVGTPIVTPLPTQAGCLTGQVDYLTYSLQLISTGLPDTASIGGTQMCSTCTVKPPAYPEIVSKMETSIGLGATVSACYDSTGNIFQITLKHP